MKMYKAEAKGWHGWELVGYFDNPFEAEHEAYNHFGHWHINVEEVEVDERPEPIKTHREPTLEEKIRECFRRY